jgi:hypothetical protein
LVSGACAELGISSWLALRPVQGARVGGITLVTGAQAIAEEDSLLTLQDLQHQKTDGRQLSG